MCLVTSVIPGVPLHPSACPCSDAAATYHDLALCTLTSGLMVDASISGAALHVDPRMNQRVFGSSVTAAQLLRGEVPVVRPPCCEALGRRLIEVESRVVADAFEPSHSGSEPAW